MDLESAAYITQDQAEELGRSLFNIAQERYEEERSERELALSTRQPSDWTLSHPR
jgi:hypothetical protein